MSETLAMSPGLFRDRRDARRQLAARLKDFANRSDLLVLALPRGGVPVDRTSLPSPPHLESPPMDDNFGSLLVYDAGPSALVGFKSCERPNVNSPPAFA